MSLVASPSGRKFQNMGSRIQAPALVEILAPYLPLLWQGRDAVAERQAAERWSTVLMLWRLLRPKLEAEPVVREAFRDAAKDPQDPDVRAALRVQVRKILATDVQLARQVEEALDRVGEPQGAAAPVRRLLELAGSGLWEGDLGEMRDDASPPRSS